MTSQDREANRYIEWLKYRTGNQSVVGSSPTFCQIASLERSL